MKLIKIINIILVVVAFVLLINLIWSFGSITSNVFYNLDHAEPICSFHHRGEQRAINLYDCCFEIQKQLECRPNNDPTYNVKCYTNAQSDTYYLINQKTLQFCKKEGYHIEDK